MHRNPPGFKIRRSLRFCTAPQCVETLRRKQRGRVRQTAYYFCHGLSGITLKKPCRVVFHMMVGDSFWILVNSNALLPRSVFICRTEYLVCFHLSPSTPFLMLLATKSAGSLVSIVVNVVFCDQSTICILLRSCLLWH